MAQWNKNTVPKCKDKTCSDEVLVTIEKQGWKEVEPEQSDWENKLSYFQNGNS